jgi:REase_DpnII-MboI
MTAGELALRELRTAMERGEPIIAIHYACESFYDAKDRPAAVACIAVADGAEGSSTAFSLSDAPPSISSPKDREVDLLRRFYEFLGSRQDARIVHWNMNSATYGFVALANRFRFLTEQPPPHEPSTDRLFDLDDIIAHKFGIYYAKDPKLPNIITLNDLRKRFYLKGADEAKRFKDNDIGAIRSSVTEKASRILDLSRLLVGGSLKTQNSVGAVEFAGQRLDAVTTIVQLGDRFLYVRRALSRRHGSRPTLEVKDEYDAQDLLRALLKIFFNNVCDESWTPTYAGGAARVDFILPDYRLAIELKFMRPTLNDRDVADQLIIDRDRYAASQNINHLVCLVFDHEGLLNNPRGLEADLARDTSQEGLAVTVRIYDR